VTDGRIRTEEPLVAVVTPVLNGDKYLQETIDAVQAQTYPSIELIISDNASTDRTAEVIEANKHRRIPIIPARNTNTLPIAKNFNAAVRLAPSEAKYVRLLCADDRMTPDCVARMVRVAETDPSIVVVGVGTVAGERESTYWWPTDRTMIEGVEMIRAFFRNERSFFAVHVLMRRSTMSHRSDAYDETLSTGLDFEAVLALLRVGNFGFVPAPLGWVRIHQDSVTSKVALTKHTHYMDFLLSLYRHGPHVFSPREFQEIVQRYEYRYVRQIVKWQSQQGKVAVQHHWDALRQVRGDIRARDIFAAAFDAFLVRTGIRQGWVGPPWRDERNL